VVILPCARWAEASTQWRLADEWGLHAGYTYDHLSWREPFREGPWFTMVPTLVAAAGVTSRLRLGPLVTSPNFRHPLLLAKDLIALDDISGGRVVVGVGSGGTGFDATTLGATPWSRGERHARFDEFTRALDQLLRESRTTREGEYYPVRESRQLPGPVQLPRPPLYVSALGPKSLALCAELAQGWVSFGDPSGGATTSTYAAVRGQVALLNDHLAAHGRSPESMRRLLLDFAADESPLSSWDAFVDWAGRYRALGFDEVVVHWPVAQTPFDYDVDLFERVCVEGRELLSRWG